MISIHALLAESDGGVQSSCFGKIIFLSTLSLRRATRYGRPVDVQLVFLSTLSLRRATSMGGHAQRFFSNFYPRSPCGERPTTAGCCLQIILFLSTLSLRRATVAQGAFAGYKMNFYPRSPCGERLADRYEMGIIRQISIHALLAESDGLFYVI